MFTDEGRQTRTDHVAENVGTERHGAETILPRAGTKRGPEAETDTGIKIEENNDKERQVRIAPPPEKREKAILKKLSEIT